MVRIFKRLNGTINAEILPFETSRIVGSQVVSIAQLTNKYTKNYLVYEISINTLEVKFIRLYNYLINDNLNFL